MVSVRAGQSTGETGMRLPSGFVAANVWPKTSPCGSVAMWTHCETQLVKVLSTVEAGPVIISPSLLVRGGARDGVFGASGPRGEQDAGGNVESHVARLKTTTGPVIFF